MVWPTTKVNDKSQYKQAHDSYNLDTGKDKFGFTIDRNSEDIQADNEHDDDCDPCRLVDLIVPIGNDDSGGRDFGAECDCGLVPIVLPFGKQRKTSTGDRGRLTQPTAKPIAGSI